MPVRDPPPCAAGLSYFSLPRSSSASSTVPTLLHHTIQASPASLAVLPRATRPTQTRWLPVLQISRVLTFVPCHPAVSNGPCVPSPLTLLTLTQRAGAFLPLCPHFHHQSLDQLTFSFLPECQTQLFFSLLHFLVELSYQT